MSSIERCRTAALGGHKDTCDSCGHVRISYNSCRDRHCPKCQNLKKAEWLALRSQRLLPTPYFHVVFTLPAKLRSLILGNKRLLFKTLFDSVAKTIQTIARDQKHLGAEVGFTAILHTWGQNLQFHPHVHCVVTGGGLSRDQDRWIAGRDDFFVSVKVLRKLFRGKFLAALRKTFDDGELQFSGTTAELRDPAAQARLFNELYAVDWVVYAKPPFGGPKQVFRYLGRYTHRVAISNHRLIELADGKVRFHAKDYADRGRRKTLTLDALEFIRRFLLHVLPRNFVRIRHYGLLAPRNVETKLQRARELIGDVGRQFAASCPSPSGSEALWPERLLLLTGVDVFACPSCKAGRLIRAELDAQSLALLASSSDPAILDTS